MKESLNSFVIADPNSCIGCKVCEVACAAAHDAGAGKTVGSLTEPLQPKLYLARSAEVTMPVQCRHCEDAPCANACAVGAIRQRRGAIVIDEQRCMGCKTCMLACPFGALEMKVQYRDGQPLRQEMLQQETVDGMADKERLVASKCDLCSAGSDGPACVTACPKQALILVKPADIKKRRSQEAAQAALDSMKKFL